MGFPHRSKAAHSSLAGRSVATQHDRDTSRGHNDPPEGRNVDIGGRNRGRTQTGPTPYPLQQAPDEETRQLAKQYFKLIQAIHHKNIIDKAILTQNPPKGMTKQVLKLTAFIKPSSPTEETRAAVTKNTETWLHNNMTILQDHYLNIILTYNNLPLNETALQIAIGWARKRYKARLTQPTIQAARSLIEGSSEPSHVSDSLPPSPVGSLVGGTPPGLNLGSKEEFPPLPKPQITLAEHRSLLLRPTTPLAYSKPNPGYRSDGGEPVVRPRRPSALNSQSTPRVGCGTPAPLMGQVEDGSTSLPLSPIVQVVNRVGAATLRPPQVPPSSSTISTPSVPLHLRKGQGQPGQNRAQTPLFSSSEDDFVLPNLSWKPSSEGRNRNRGDIQTLHSNKTGLSNVAVIEDGPLIQTLTQNTVNNHSPPASLGRDVVPRWEPGRKPTQSSSSDKQNQVVGEQMMIEGPTRHNNAGLSEKQTSSDPTKTTPEELNDPTTSNSTHVPNNPGLAIDRTQSTEQQPGTAFLPTHHKARKGRKILDWSFRGRKPIWFLGDSNLNRIPPHYNKNIQIDSYPGASFYHFQQVLGKTPTHPQTKLVVLSVGINNRDQDPEKTSIKQLRILYRKAQSVFPNACVYFPLINYSPLLPQEQQDNLITINTFIFSHFPSLRPLPGDRFNTTLDNIHWTQETAQELFGSWCNELHLNL